MTTATDFQNKLEALKAEQTALMNSAAKRTKSVRNRIQEITAEFYQTKAEWRAKLGPTSII